MLLLFLREEGTRVGPAAGGGLAGHQAQGHGADERLVLGVAEAVEEQDRQAQLIGGVQRGDLAAHVFGCLADVRIIGRNAAFQQRQARQGGQADGVGLRPAAVAPLGFLQPGDAVVDGPVDLFLLLGRQHRLRRRLRRRQLRRPIRRHVRRLRTTFWRIFPIRNIGRSRRRKDRGVGGRRQRCGGRGAATATSRLSRFGRKCTARATPAPASRSTARPATPARISQLLERRGAASSSGGGGRTPAAGGCAVCMPAAKAKPHPGQRKRLPSPNGFVVRRLLKQRGQVIVSIDMAVRSRGAHDRATAIAPLYRRDGRRGKQKSEPIRPRLRSGVAFVSGSSGRGDPAPTVGAGSPRPHPSIAGIESYTPCVRLGLTGKGRNLQ